VKHTTIGKVVAGTTLALALGVLGGAAVAAGPVLFSPQGLSAELGIETAPMPEPTYSVNSSGETFGSATEARSPKEEPALIQAEATNGKAGYVRKAELDAVNGADAMDSFKSPEDALAWQTANQGKEFTIPVYLQDGVTVIGEFLVTNEQPRQ